MTKILKFPLLISCISLFSGCFSSKTDIQPTESPVKTNYASLLNTIETEDDMIIPFNATIKLQTHDEQALDILDPVFQEQMLYYGKLFDGYHIYDDLNNLMTINEAYGNGQAITVDESLIDLLELSIEIAEISDGKFNPTVGQLYDIWKDKFSPFPIENTDPTEEEINEALACTVPVSQLRDIIVIDEDSSTVQFNALDTCASQVQINLGAIAKGYALDLTNQELSTYDVPYMIDAGNSSISVYIPTGQSDTFYVGVRNPYARVMSLFDYEITESTAFTSSGDDSQYFLLDNGDGTQTIRHHILDATDGYPHNYQRTITIQSDLFSNGIADALSTALFNCASQDEKQQLLDRIEDHYHIQVEYAYFVGPEEDATLYMTSGFDAHIMPSSLSSSIIYTEVLP